MGVTRCPATLALASVLFEEEGEGFSSFLERPSCALFFDLVSKVEVEVRKRVISGGIGQMRACCCTFVGFLGSGRAFAFGSVLRPANFLFFFSFRECYMSRGCPERRDVDAGSVFSQASVSFSTFPCTLGSATFVFRNFSLRRRALFFSCFGS